MAGDQVGYLLGKKFRRRWFKDDARVLRTSHLAQTEDFFRRHGGSAIVLARFVPVVRTFTPLAAGIVHYTYRKFALWNILGAIGWSASVILLGSWLGHFDLIANNIDLIAVAMVLVSVLPWGIEYLKRRKNLTSSGRDKTMKVDEPNQRKQALR